MSGIYKVYLPPPMLVISGALAVPQVPCTYFQSELDVLKFVITPV